MAKHSLIWRIKNNVDLVGPFIKKKILFIHPPKCGGTSTFHAIKKSYGVKNNFLHGNLHNLNNTASTKAADHLNMNQFHYRNQLLTYFLSQDSKFIYGHFAFPFENTRGLLKDWSLVTMLRNPVDRWFSHYFFSSTIDSGTYQSPEEELRSKLKNFLETQGGRAAGMGSSYLLLFGGKSDFSTLTPEDAIRNLENFDVVGRIEDIGTFERSFNEKFSSRIRIKRLNTNKKAPRDNQAVFGDDLYNAVSDLCDPNMQVYRHFFSS